MLKVRDRRHIRDWIASRGVIRILVISPHLDDAVFSTRGLLLAVPKLVTVVTVFSKGGSHSGTHWARATGFRDPLEEHAARREEDRNATEIIGCKFRHLGFCGEQFTGSRAHRQVQKLLEESPESPASTLVLQPACAGSARKRSSIQKWLRRILRQPSGSMIHSEHETTRDYLLAAHSDARV